MTIREFHAYAKERLSCIYTIEESRALAERLLEHCCSLPKYALYTEPNRELPSSANGKISPLKWVEELAQGRPLQYLLGYEHFCGHKINVNSNVLIPRPETEELVQLILERHTTGKLTIADICTGSGCIAWALAAALPPDAAIEGYDISAGALEVAIGQASNFPSVKKAPQFYRIDILREALPEHSYNIIVSNPPYVLQSERAQMRRNVCSEEPDIALFVPDEEPLLFYSAIARQAAFRLASGGSLYFEINERFGQQVCRMLEEEGFSKIELHKDLFGKERFTSAQLR